MKKCLTTASVAVFSILLVLLTADVSNAQPDWARNKNYTKKQVDKVIKRVENQMDKFVSRFDNALDNSRLNNTRREDNLNQKAKDLEAASDELRREFDRRESWWETRENVQRCLSLASDIDVAVRNRRLDNKTENLWANLRQELNNLAQVYDLERIG